MLALTTLLFVSLLGGSLFLPEKEAAEIIDRVLAGIDANLALIESGSATYNKSLSLYVDNVEQPPQRETLTTIFHDENVRWIGDASCGLFDRSKAVTFSPIGSDEPPFKTNIIVRERALSQITPRLVSPKSLGHVVAEDRTRDIYLSDLIRAARKDDKQEILVNRDDSTIILTFRVKPERASEKWMKSWKGIYHVDPSQGYGVTRMQDFGIPDWPHSEFEATYLRADNGAYVAKHYEGFERVRKNGLRKDVNHVIVDLLSIDLNAAPSDEDFTLAAMGVPVGARIQDRIENREYLYEIAAVTEDEIEQEWRRMRDEHEEAIEANRKSRRNWTIGSMLAGIVLLAVAFVGIRMYRAA